jgi:thermostable 8-oxoguanine DNA glycosylase
MIVPEKITDFNRTESELEEFLMFAILVAGKTAKTQAQKLEEFLSTKIDRGYSNHSPFEYINALLIDNALMTEMKRHKLGQYNRLKTAFQGIVDFAYKLKTITVQDLESVKGIGPKTARFFILHSRKEAKVAVLDTHILKWLREQGYDAPKTTPSKKKYGLLEQLFLTEAWKRELSPADLDLTIWKSYAKV